MKLSGALRCLYTKLILNNQWGTHNGGNYYDMG
jgi:hypothetical protein